MEHFNLIRRGNACVSDVDFPC